MGFFKPIHISAPKPIDIGGAFRDLGNKINTSVQHTNAAVAQSNNTIRNEFNKPEVMRGLQGATKIALGVTELALSVLPGGSGANRAINMSLAAGNGASHGQVNAWTGIGDTNSTLNMLPGGLLSQNIASVETNGKSNEEMNRFVPDPKRMAMNEVKGVVTHPSGTLSVAKTVTQQNVYIVKQSMFSAAATGAPVSTLDAAVNKPPLPKPSLVTHFMPLPYMPQRRSTLPPAIASLPPASIVPISTLTKTEDKPVATIQPVEVKPSIVAALVTATVEATPPPPPTSTLTANNQRTINTPVTTLATAGPPSFFAMLFALIFGKA
jgi:hypothetical protein